MIEVILGRYQMEMRNVVWKLEDRHDFYEVRRNRGRTCGLMFYGRQSL